jgi:hypothetical protein
LPSEEAAKKYLQSALPRFSEGVPEDKKAPKVGEDCRVFGPENPKIAALLGVSVRGYIYAFRNKNVVVKLFVAQGLESKEKLEAKAMVELSTAIMKRIDENTK